MTTLHEALVFELENNPGFSAHVGDRIYPDRLPQGVTYPATKYQMISNVPEYTHSGRSASHPRMQLDHYGETKADARKSAELAAQALEGKTGGWGGAEPVLVSACFVVDERDFHEPDIDAYRVMQDFIIWHGKAA